MLSLPATSPSQSPAPPTPVAHRDVAEKKGKLPVIQTDSWHSLSSDQRQIRFKAHYDAVQTSWKGISEFLEKSVDQAGQALNAEPANPAKLALLASRKKALRQLNNYLFDKAHPKMLDPMYLNQTREHLQDIHQQLGNPDIDSESRLGAVLELVQGLDVCREGVALNILACAKNLNTRTQGHPLAGLYHNAREELINQHLLRAVRASHSTPVYSNKQGTTKLIGHKESQKTLDKSMEIHDVQALRNALSKELDLEYQPDKYIDQDYEDDIGTIAKAQIPQLITTHAVASRVADDLLNRIRSTGLLSEQVLSVDGNSAMHQVVDISGNQYKDLTTTLQNEMGVDASLLFDSPDDDFGKLALVSHETLVSRLVDWIGQEQSKAGSPVHGLGEANHQPVTGEQVNQAIGHFLAAGLPEPSTSQIPSSSTTSSSPSLLASAPSSPLPTKPRAVRKVRWEPVASNSIFQLSTNAADDKKKKKEALDNTSTQTSPSGEFIPLK